MNILPRQTSSRIAQQQSSNLRNSKVGDLNSLSKLEKELVRIGHQIERLKGNAASRRKDEAGWEQNLASLHKGQRTLSDKLRSKHGISEARLEWLLELGKQQTKI